MPGVNCWTKSCPPVISLLRMDGKTSSTQVISHQLLLLKTGQSQSVGQCVCQRNSNLTFPCSIGGLMSDYTTKRKRVQMFLLVNISDSSINGEPLSEVL